MDPRTRQILAWSALLSFMGWTVASVVFFVIAPQWMGALFAGLAVLSLGALGLVVAAPSRRFVEEDDEMVEDLSAIVRKRQSLLTWIRDNGRGTMGLDTAYNYGMKTGANGYYEIPESERGAYFGN